MTTLSHEEIQQLLGAFALDAVDTDECDLIDAQPDGRTYQLWGRAGDDLVSLGVLGRSSRCTAAHI
jgi:hypothetical protein